MGITFFQMYAAAVQMDRIVWFLEGCLTMDPVFQGKKRSWDTFKTIWAMKFKKNCNFFCQNWPIKFFLSNFVFVITQRPIEIFQKFKKFWNHCVYSFYGNKICVKILIIKKMTLKKKIQKIKQNWPPVTQKVKNQKMRTQEFLLLPICKTYKKITKIWKLFFCQS